MNKLKVLTVSWCDARNTGYQDDYLNQTLSNIKNIKLFVAFPKIPVLPPKNSRFFYKPALSWRKIIYDKKQNNKINYKLIVDTHRGDYRKGYKKLTADWRKGKIKTSDHFRDLILGILSKIFYKLGKPWKRYILKKVDSLVTIKKKV